MIVFRFRFRLCFPSSVLFALFLVAGMGNLSAQGKWKYQLAFGGELKSGNVNTTIFNTSGGVERNDSILALDAGYAIVYGRKDKVDFDRGLTANVKFDVWQYSQWSPFFLATYQNNKFKGYEYKMSVLLGGKYRIYSKPKVCDYSISAAYMMDYTEYFAKDRDDDRFRPQVSRVSLRFKMRHRINDVVSISHITFYQPSLMDLGGLRSVREDYVVNSVTTIENKVGKMLFLDLKFAYEYRSLVPDDIKNTDIVSSVSLRLVF